jgi:hypothetical protein
MRFKISFVIFLMQPMLKENTKVSVPYNLILLQDFVGLTLLKQRGEEGYVR